MDKVKKYMIIVLGILIILILILALTIKNNNRKKILSNIFDDNSGPQDVLNTQIEKIKPTMINSENTYFTVNKCVEDYLSMLEASQGDVLYEYLNENYINKNNLSKNDIIEKLVKYNNYDGYVSEEAYELNGEVNSIYFIKGKIDLKEVFFEVTIDYTNSTFDIMPVENEEYNNDINTGVDSNEIANKNISKKTYNIIAKTNLSDADIVRSYYKRYAKLIVEDSEEAYERLNSTYKKQRYKNYEDFQKYVEENKNEFDTAYKIENIDNLTFNGFNERYIFEQKNKNYAIENYQVLRKNDDIVYIGVNGFGNYFIFEVSKPGMYNVILDNHTIDLSEFTEKYNSSKAKDKVAMNAEKIKDALNTKDYGYIYEKLNDTFKKNNYPTQQQFENYIKDKVYEYNKFEYTKMEEQGETYILYITVKDQTEEKEENKNLAIIMQLNEGTDFTMSFSID